jgi:hypothetical protein
MIWSMLATCPVALCMSGEPRVFYLVHGVYEYKNQLISKDKLVPSFLLPGSGASLSPLDLIGGRRLDEEKSGRVVDVAELLEPSPDLV